MIPPLTRIPPQVVAAADYEVLARERVTAEAWAYLSGGAADEITLRENQSAFEKYRIVPRVLRDPTSASTRVSMLGKAYDHPLWVAPMAFHRLFHPEGETATALGAAAVNCGMVVSSQSSQPLEAVAPHASNPWFQLYFQPDRDFTLALMHRAEAAGYQALVVTVDAPLTGFRNREQRAGFRLPEGVAAVNLRGKPVTPAEDRIFGNSLLKSAPTWQDITWLRSQTALPILLKGILSAADTRLAVDHGIAGVIVSNHGGRTLDSVPATLDVLPGIAAEAGGTIPVMMDGGIRRGTDIFKALALGADAVLVGRPVLHGLAAAGSIGVAHVLKILLAELELAMVLAGCRSVEEARAEGVLMKV